MVLREGSGDDGASAVEYGLLIAAIAAVIIIMVFALGGFVKGAFKDTCDQLDAVLPASVTQTCA